MEEGNRCRRKSAEDVVAHASGGCAIHNGVFAHGPGLGIVVDDELDGFVDPAVAETSGDLDA